MWETFALMVWDLAVQDGRRWGSKYELLHEGRCLCCNRKLTDPISIQTGIGPVCAGRE